LEQQIEHEKIRFPENHRISINELTDNYIRFSAK